MYTPKLYDNPDTAAIRRFIDRNPFAVLVSAACGHAPLATHLPLILEADEQGGEILIGHLSKANPQWQSWTDNDRVLAIFSGPHHYISSSWYGHVNVPTWNYIAVHLYGQIRLLDDEATFQAVRRLMDRYESPDSSPVSMDKLPPNMIGREMRGVVGFKISVEEVQAQWKLSQNRNDEDHARIVEELLRLQDEQARALAAAMQENRPKQ
ncbi:MAG: FMN-binding negative transcriptional regulator [Saprospiraceae bacterium]